jgi:hypothetical protein
MITKKGAASFEAAPFFVDFSGDKKQKGLGPYAMQVISLRCV